MSLTARVSAFFLTALAFTLLGFTLTLYGLAHVYLYHRLEERLQAALATLSAAVEVDGDGLEWEARERRLDIGEGLVWTVHDPAGHLLDHSPNLTDNDPLLRPLKRETDEVPATDTAGRPRPGQRRVFVGTDGAAAEPSGKKFASLTLTVAASAEPVRGTLRALAAALAGVSAATWLLAFVIGRRLCRRALRPLLEMTEAARTMNAEQRQVRLPTRAGGDELTTLGRSFNGLLDRLHEAYERQSRFTGDASHQLRTPLTALLGQVEVCLRQPRTAEDYRQVLERVRTQGHNLRRLVEGLLYLARADAEGRLDDTAPLELTAWLPLRLDDWAAHPRRSDLRLELPPAPPVWVRCQAALLGQLLDNLLDNALKYSEAGSPVIVRLEAVGEGAILTVEDRGCGIAAEDAPHVFEPFYRAGSGRRPDRPGVGLGLAVVRRLAHLFGGEADVSSRPGEGSRFTVRLPRTAAIAESL